MPDQGSEVAVAVGGNPVGAPTHGPAVAMLDGWAAGGRKEDAEEEKPGVGSGKEEEEEEEAIKAGVVIEPQ